MACGGGKNGSGRRPNFAVMASQAPINSASAISHGVSRCTRCKPANRTPAKEAIARASSFVTMHESPFHGLNFCKGTVAAMLDDPGREIFDVIRWFVGHDKLFNVHFRNIRGRRLDFVETFLEEGDM